MTTPRTVCFRVIVGLIGGCLAPALTAAVTSSAYAGTIFSEDFSGATPGANNNLSGTQLQLTSGAVDIIGVLHGSFFTCANNPAGNCLDLVGSPGLGSVRSTPTFNLVAGDTYTISFGYILQGFSPGTTPTSDFTVGLGSFSDRLTAIPTVEDASINFTPAADESGAFLSLTALTSPDDFHGPVLDHIVITETSGGTPVPEPGTLALLAATLGLLGGVWGLRTIRMM